MVKKRKLRWYGQDPLDGEDNSARDSERSTKERKTEEEIGR